MEYSQVMLEMLERIKVLENKVKVLEEKIENTPTPKPQTAMQLDKVSAKYRGLAEYLFEIVKICAVEKAQNLSFNDNALDLRSGA